MNQGNNYENYGYDPYDQPRGRGLTEKVFGPRIAQKLRSPAVAAITLIIAGAAFAGVIIGSYSGGGEEEAVPIIRADVERFRSEPTDPGGMDVPHADSTVFNTLSQSTEPQGAVENLLADSEAEEPIDKSEVLADAEAEASVEPASGEGTISGEPKVEGSEQMAKSEAVVKAPTTIKQEVIKIIPPEDVAVAEPAAETLTPAAKPEQLQSAGTAPETLAYVRSVLDKKDTKQVVNEVTTASAAATAPAAPEPAAETAAKIAPAAGNASGGVYYVQVASVTDQGAAPTEWGKLQKTLTELSGLDYRVQRADLEKGIYFRIQAGPLDKEAANSLCDSIKAQKPGGCLVVR